MNEFKSLEVWFVTGSQFLYGEETLKTVDSHSQEIVNQLGRSEQIPITLIFKPVLKTPDEIYECIRDANSSKNCIGVIAWMHTFSPAKMWIGGLKILRKPLLHLHTQFNRDIPWKSIDMDFMKPISIFIPSVLASRMVNFLMLVAPFGQAIVNVIFIRVDLTSGCYTACNNRLDRHLLHIG